MRSSTRRPTAGGVAAFAVLLLLLLTGHWPIAAFAQSNNDERAPSVALVTIAPGDIYWQRFGHNTLLVTPADSDKAVSYNFGY